MDGTGKVALVTGAAGGLGAATTQLLAERGWHVFAGDLAGDALDRLGARDRVTSLELDVTDDASIAAAVDVLGGHSDGLDAVVNFAGVLAVGSLVEITATDLARLLDINVLGTFRVNRACFPLLQRRRGRVVLLSSETGRQAAAPFNGPYAMSKHAIEAYGDALRRELMLLGMDVVKIQPGPFATGMVGGIERQFRLAAQESTHFSDVLGRMLPRLAAEQRKARDPRELAEVIHSAVTVRRPRPAYAVGQDRQRALFDLLPARVADALLTRVLAGPAPLRRGRDPQRRGR